MRERWLKATSILPKDDKVDIESEVPSVNGGKVKEETSRR